jgi:putative transposase
MSTKHKRTIRTLSHSFYVLKYHIVWTPMYRGKVLDDQKVKDELRRIFECIAIWKQWEILELNIQPDHIHLCLLASPRYSVSYIMQILKGNQNQKRNLRKRIYVGTRLLCFHNWYRRIHSSQIRQTPRQTQPSKPTKFI